MKELKLYLHIVAFAFFLSLSLTGCEKTIITEENEEDIETDKGENDDSDTGIDTLQAQFLTIAETQTFEDGDVVWVTGFIVASCQRYMKNCDFTAPFEGSSAIILSDVQVDKNSLPHYEDNTLFPVCLTTHAPTRACLNLVDNPQLWNKKIYLVGLKGRYFGRDGIKAVYDYTIAE